MKLYKNATFISCEKENETFECMAVEHGHIVWLGQKEDLKNAPKKVQTAKRIDLQGATVTPAFGDSHIHFESFSMFENTFYIMDIQSFDEGKRILQDYAAHHPKSKVLLGYGACAHLVSEKRLPEKKDLDQWSDRPIFIVKYDGHAAVCNSAMMQLLSEDVLNDPNCHQETGWLYGSAFYHGTNEATAYISTMNILKGIIKGANYLSSVGIGLVHNVEGVGFKNDLDVDMIRMISPALPQTYRIFFQTMDVDTCKKHHLKRIGGCFKLALDGCFGSEDAALLKPYENNPDNMGVLNYTDEEVADFTIKANRAGLQITMHCIGDRAVEQCIRAYEKAYEDQPWEDARHIMIHVCMASKEQLERAAKIKLCIAAQSPFIYWKQEPDHYLCSVLGRERTDALNPLKTMHDLGIVVADGSDGPCTRPQPLRAMMCSVTHPNPAERISRYQALRMITYNPAYLTHEEDQRGSLKVSKIADFVVLSENPLEVPAEKIETIQVKALYLHGTKVKKLSSSVLGMFIRSLRVFSASQNKSSIR